MVTNEVIIDTSVGPIDKKEVGNYIIDIANLELVQSCKHTMFYAFHKHCG